MDVRRSVLFMAINNPRFLRGAARHNCDGVILDLEDAVAEPAQGVCPGAAPRGLLRGVAGAGPRSRSGSTTCTGRPTWTAASGRASR